MAASAVRLVTGTLMLAGAAAGAVGAPQPGAAAEKVASAVSGPLFLGVFAGLVVVLALLASRQVTTPSQAGRHRA